MRTPIPIIQSWPLKGIDSEGRFSWSTNDLSVREVILNILLTRPGERIMRNDFGAGLINFVHQPNNETTRNLISSVVRKSIERWEYRIVVESVEVTQSPTNVADVHINIRYRMRFNHLTSELGFTFNLGQVA